MTSQPDQRSFILGMITAFCECVAGGCKCLALSPPMEASVFASVESEANAIIEKHGLLHFHERNLDVSPDLRIDWILIAGKQETIDEYLELRKLYSPIRSLVPFHSLLSYNEALSVHTGYDAYHAYFPSKTPSDVL